MSDNGSEAKSGEKISDGIDLVPTLPVARTEEAEEALSNMTTILAALHPTVDRHQFAAAVIAELNMLPERCTTKSVLVSCYNLAVLGLIPGDSLGHAWFSLESLNKGQPDEMRICQLQIGYQGFLELAFASEFLIDCHPELVYAGEDFELFNTADGPQVKHDLTPRMKGEVEMGWNKIMCAYCVYHTKNGGHGVVSVPKKDLERIYNHAGPKSVWKERPEAMSLKTGVRRASKYWRKTKQLGNAVLLDEQHEIGNVQPSLLPVESTADKVVDPAKFV